MYPDRRHAHVLPRGGRRIRRRPGRDLQFEQPRRLAAARLGEDRRTGRDGTRLCGLGQQQGDFGDLLRQGGDRLAARIGRSRNRRADRIGRVQPATASLRSAAMQPAAFPASRAKSPSSAATTGPHRSSSTDVRARRTVTAATGCSSRSPRLRSKPRRPPTSSSGTPAARPW